MVADATPEFYIEHLTQMYAPGTRRHIKAALKAGATMVEIMGC
jgi:hypothetical protein